MAVQRRIILLLCILLSLSATAQTAEIVRPFYLWDTTPYPLPEQTEVITGIPLDSIFPPRELLPPVVRPSLFSHTTLPLTHDDLQERANTAPAPWLFAALVVLLGLLFLYYKRTKLRIIDLLKAATDHRAMDRLIRGNNLTTTRLVPMGLFVIATLATSIYLMALSHNGITAWLLLFGALTIAYMLRNIVARLLGNVFNDSDTLSAGIASNYIYHLLLATSIAPLLLLQAYLPVGRETVFYIIVALTALELLLRLFRALKLFLTLSKSRSFYLFYYLCTVEIVPLLVIAKWFFAQ